ncbi:Sodium-dependent multivitamin transporter [Lamellibrachia satsuma]|nr:Sodium-dependent multivitamin transporter [Lamellibrachia satsuma]
MHSLHWFDYFILAAFLLVSVGIGVYHALTGGRQRTTSEFIMANRKLQVIPTVISMMVSFQSAIMILGIVAEMYSYGSQAWLWVIIGLLLGLVIVERVFIPWLYPLKLISVFEYLELRYQSKAVRLFGSTLGIVAAILYMGVAMYAPSVALEVATGLPLYMTVPVMALVCTAYTALGGMRAVIWTDVFQFVVLMTGLIVIVVRGIVVVGGISRVFDIANNEGRIFWITLDFDPRVRHTLWGFVFGWSLAWSNVYGLSQSAVQRYCATASLREARMVVLLNIPLVITSISMVALTGLTVFAYYSDIGCDPLASHQISSGNELLPHFVTKVFGDTTGFYGVFLSILYSGALSSVSSSLSASAANTWEDVLKPRLPHLDEYRAALLNKLIVIVYGGVAIAVAFFVAVIPGPITQVTTALVSSVASPLFGIFLLGGLFRKANWKGALVGGIVGVCVMLTINLGALTVKGYHPTLPPTSTDQCEFTLNSTVVRSAVIVTGLSQLFTISYMWYLPLGAGATISTGLIVSFITRYFSDSVDKELPEKLFIQLDMFKFTCGEDSSKVDDNVNMLANKKDNSFDNPAVILDVSV